MVTLASPNASYMGKHSPAKPVSSDQDVISTTSWNYRCNADGCNYSNRDFAGIILHMRTHFEYEILEGDRTKVTFVFKNGMYRCNQCDRQTSCLTSFREHVRHHILKVPYKCKLCSCDITSIPELRRHYSVSHPKTPLKLSILATNGKLNKIITKLKHDKTVTLDFTNLPTDDGCGKEDCFSTDESDVKNEPCTAASLALATSAQLVGYAENHTMLSVTLRSVKNIKDNSCLPSSSVVNCKDPVGRPRSTKLSGFAKSEVHSEYPSSVDESKDVTEPPQLLGYLVHGYTHVGPTKAPPKNSDFTKEVHSEQNSNSCFTNTINTCTDKPYLEPLQLSSAIRKFRFVGGEFQCLNCSNFRTFSEETFCDHAFIHIHDNPPVCLKKQCQSRNCLVLSALIVFLRSLESPKSGDDIPSSKFKKSFKNISLVDDCKSALGKEHPDTKSGSPPITDIIKPQKLTTMVPIIETLPELNKSTSSTSLPNDLLEDVEPTKEPHMLEDLCLLESSAVERGKVPKLSSDNITIKKMRVSEPAQLLLQDKTMDTFRSKTTKLLDFSKIAITETAVPNKMVQVAQSTCVVDDTERNCPITLNSSPISTNSSLSTSSVGESLTNSPRNRKQKPTVRSEDAVVEFCTFYRDATPLSTKCNLCSFTCNCKVQLDYHLDSCHKQLNNSNAFQCLHCHFSDSSKQTLVWHMAHHMGYHTLKLYGCQICQTQSTSSVYIQKHMVRSHSQKPQIQCDISETVNISYMDGIFKCPFCDGGFPWGYLFFRHIEKSHNLMQVAELLTRKYDRQCPDVISLPKELMKNCKNSRLSAEASSSSIGSVKKGDIEIYTCSQCDFSCNSSAAYLDHYYSHEPDKTLRMKNNSDSENTVPVADKKQSHSKPNSAKRSKKTAMNRTITSSNTPKPLNKRKSRIIRKRTKSPVARKTNPKSLELVYRSRHGWINKYKSPSAASTSRAKISPSLIPSIPRNLQNPDICEFEKGLPNTFVFSEPIKCPKCYYTDKVRLNLIRHYNTHLSEQDKPEMSVPVGRKSALSFRLWNPSSLTSENSKKTGDRKLRSSQQNDPITPHRSDYAVSKRKSSSELVMPILTPELVMLSSTTTASNLTEKPLSPTRTSSALFPLSAATPVSSVSSPVFGQYLEKYANQTSETHRCISCSSAFSEQSDLKKHLADCHATTYYVCRCCGIMILGLAEAEQHFRNKHPGSQTLVDPLPSAKNKPGKRKDVECQDANLPQKKSIRLEVEKEPETDEKLMANAQNKPAWRNFYNSNPKKQVENNKASSVIPSTPKVPNIPTGQDMTKDSDPEPESLAYKEKDKVPPPAAPALPDFTGNGAPFSPTPSNSFNSSTMTNSSTIQLLMSQMQIPPFVTQEQFLLLLNQFMPFVQANYNPFAQQQIAQNCDAFMNLIQSTTINSSIPNSNTVVDGEKSLPETEKTFTFVKNASGASDSMKRPSDCADPTRPPSAASSSTSTISKGRLDRDIDSDTESTSSYASQRSDTEKPRRRSAVAKKSSKAFDRKRKSDVPKSSKIFSGETSVHADRSSSGRSRAASSISDRSRATSQNSDRSSSTPGTGANVRADANRIRLCCSLCLFTTRHRRQFENHLAGHFVVREESYADQKSSDSWNPLRLRCAFCSFTSYLQEEFEDHVATHTVMKPFQCSYCAYSGFTKQAINGHLRRYHADRQPLFHLNSSRLMREVLEGERRGVDLDVMVKVTDVLKLSKRAAAKLRIKYGIGRLNLYL